MFYRKTDNYCHKRLGQCKGPAHCEFYKEKPPQQIMPEADGEETTPAPPPVSPIPPRPVEENEKYGFKVGERVFHKNYGFGKLDKISGDCFTIHFENEDEGVKKINIRVCLKYKLLFHS